MTKFDYIAGSVVLYNPTDDVYDNIVSYSRQVSKLYVVDNSIQRNRALVERLNELQNAIFLDQHGNKGIAAALNVGANEAIKDGFKFLLTMDQDTGLEADYVAKLSGSLPLRRLVRTGIIAPRYTKKPNSNVEELEEVLITMTSGNILNLSVFQQVGPFLEELFIDHVDHEYCLRLNAKGFSVVQVNDVEIIHRPGTLTSVIGGRIKFASHSPQRLYYFCRNGFYVCNKYKKLFPAFTKHFASVLTKEIAKVPFQESKWIRLEMIAFGYLDYKKNKLGKLELRS